MIGNINDFKDIVVEFIGMRFSTSGTKSLSEAPIRVSITDFPFKADLHCSQCGDIRKNEISPLFIDENFNERYFEQIQLRARQLGKYDKDQFVNQVFNRLSSSFWKCECLQCGSISHIVIYNGPRGQEFIILPSSFGGLSTPNTPKNVSFYLDQANRSHILGANSAAMAMYRSAIEHILVEQGYDRRMLGNKIQDLVRDIGAGSAPSWAYEFDTDFLQYIKKLGDSAVHANDGRVEQQINLDNELIKSVKGVISFLLFTIYEASHKKQFLLDSLKSTMEKMES